jgi:integrase
LRCLRSAEGINEGGRPAAEKGDARTHLAVLLGGDAGLRLGEILGLEWSDVDSGRGLLKVQRAIYEGHVTLPKGGKPRIVPMTARLKAALQEHRHLRGPRVLYQDDGQPTAKWWLKWLVDGVERRAGLRRGGRIHIRRRGSGVGRGGKADGKRPVK